MRHIKKEGVRSSGGSISIEGAITSAFFSFTVFFLIGMIQYFCLYYMTANAVLTASEKLACDSCIFYKSGLESLKENVRRKAMDCLPEDGMSGKIANELALVALSKIESGAWTAVMQGVLAEELEKERVKSGLPFKAEIVSLAGSEFYENGNEFTVKVYTRIDYVFPVIFGKGAGVRAFFCLKGNGWLYGGCSRYTVDEINVWELPSLKRGRVLEEIYGSNLPSFFPVIDIIDRKTGVATMLYSVDATAPSYASERELLRKVLNMAEKLAAFEEGECDGVTVTKKEIKSKKMILILPDNLSGLENAEKLLRISNECMVRCGITVEVSFYQHSYQYESG